MMFRVCLSVGLGLCLVLVACSSETGEATDTSAEADSLVIVDEGSNEDLSTISEDVPPTPPEVARATCDDYVGGHISLSTEHNVEAYPDYDEELAALDLSSLPQMIRLDEVGLIQRSLVAFMLEIDLDLLPETMSRDDIAAVEPFGKAILGAFALNQSKGHPGLDLIFLRRGLHRYYQCHRQFPLSIDDFQKAIFDYSDIEPYELLSIPKNRIRRIFEDHEKGVYVAETIIDGTARETEILLTKHRSDNAIDFVVYDHEGNLMDRSEFVTTVGTDIGGASPYGCIACHFEPGTFRINIIFPDMDPVAPQ